MEAGRGLRPALLAFLAVLALPHGAPAQEREEILSYDVEIELADGGLMDVTERIAVRALGEEIRRAIHRDFPTSFPRASGLGRIEAPLEVLEVVPHGTGADGWTRPRWSASSSRSICSCGPAWGAIRSGEPCPGTLAGII